MKSKATLLFMLAAITVNAQSPEKGDWTAFYQTRNPCNKQTAISHEPNRVCMNAGFNMCGKSLYISGNFNSCNYSPALILRSNMSEQEFEHAMVSTGFKILSKSKK